MATIPGRSYEPFYPSEPGEKVTVEPFLLDRRPVTQAQFLDFVRKHPKWRRSKVPRLFAEKRFLKTWKGDLQLPGPSTASHPVVWVSWFAADAYCEAQGKRLPTEAEWELAARADGKTRDGMTRAEGVQRILKWYSKPQRELRDVGAGEPNVYGVHDLHGLVWEWVSDFNGSMVSGDNRQEGDRENARFCGGATIGSADVANYAAFMRFAFRSSLRAAYTVPNLGFRCARDQNQGKKP